MIKTKNFTDNLGYLWESLTKFLNENEIKKDQIIKIVERKDEHGLVREVSLIYEEKAKNKELQGIASLFNVGNVQIEKCYYISNDSDKIYIHCSYKAWDNFVKKTGYNQGEENEIR